MNKTIIASLAIVAVGGTASCGEQEERLQTLENICTYVESDDLNVEDVSPTPDDIIRKYNVTTNDVLRDLWTLSAKYSPSETNECAMGPPWYTELSYALGLTAEAAAEVALTVVDEAANDYSANFALVVDGTKLKLRNNKPGGMVIILR